MLPFVISGLVSGAVYGLAGTGLVLTYKSSGFFNFSHGALATIAAYIFYTLHIQHHLAWPLAAAICILVVPVPVAFALETVGRSIARGGLAVQVSATVGLALALQAVVLLVYGVETTRSVPAFLAHGQFPLGSTNVQYADLVTFLVAVVTTASLYIFFRFSRAGVAMRGIVDDPNLLALCGTEPVRVRRASWVIGVAFASTSGVLFAALFPLDPVLLTLLVVQAFGAAALGGFSSLPLTFAGGLGIGVLASLSTTWFTSGLLAGVPPAVPFIVLFLVLLVFPKRYLLEGSRILPRSKAGWTAPTLLQLGGGAALLAVLLCVPAFAGIRVGVWTTAVGATIIFLSLGLLVRLSGQVSLCHVGFAAIGACALAHFSVDQHLPWGLALALSGLVAVPIGALLAIPAMRLTGLYLALATFGFGVALSYMFYTQDYMFGDTGIGLTVPRPGGFASDSSYYYLALAITVVATLLVVFLGRGRLGRLLRGIADSPMAMTTSGSSVNITRLLVFCLSAFMAAVGGGVVAAGQQTISGISYPPLLSLTFLVLVVISVGGAPWYAIMAAGLLYLVPSYVSDEKAAYWLQLGFGLAALAYAALPARVLEVPAPARHAIDRVFRRGRTIRTAVATADAPVVAKVPGGRLEVRDITVVFNGNVAVDGFSLAAATGRITGLIGPNGAGKTTTFNACSGLRRPDSGEILLDGHRVTHAGPASRARHGLGRTFQRMEIFDSLSVRDNVAMGWEGSRAAANPLTHIVAWPAEKLAMRAATESAIALCDLADVADQPAGSLSTGQRRLVELARCLAGPFRLLLLDEPSSGLDKMETERFAAILRRVVDERGVGVLLVEHDMALVMDVCEHIYVLDFGKPLFDGAPAEVLAAPIVRAAYLGDQATTDLLVEGSQR